MQPSTREHGAIPPNQGATRRVHRQHGALFAEIADLSQRLDEVGNAPSASLAARLQALATRLSRHFEDEERVGFVRNVLDAAPHLSRRAQGIVREHGELRDDMDRIVRAALRPLPAWETLRIDFARLAEALREHEGREDDLLREAFLEDLGGSG